MTSSESVSSSSKPSPPVPWVTEVGIAGFLMVAVLAVSLRGDLDPVTRYLSEYGVGPSGWVMRLAFVLLGTASLNLAVGFLRGDRTVDGGRRVGVFLTVWSVAVLAAAVFPVDIQGTPITPVGAVHLVASLTGFLSLFAAMAVGTRRFRASEPWRPLAKPTLAVAVLAPLVFLLEVSLFSTLDWVGVGQWLLFALTGGWLAMLGRAFTASDR